MTVLAFMVPSRVSSRPKAQSRKGRERRTRGRPERRRNPYPRKPNVYTVKTWRPPVPEPLPPAPLLGLKDLGLIGLSALLSQLWSRLNGPARSRMEGKTDYPGNTAEITVSGSYSLTGSTVVALPFNSLSQKGFIREGNVSTKPCMPTSGWVSGFTSNPFNGFQGIWTEQTGVGSCSATKAVDWGVIDGAGARIKLGTQSSANSTGSITALVGDIPVRSTAPGAVTINQVPTLYPWQSPEVAKFAPLEVTTPLPAPVIAPEAIPLPVKTPSEDVSEARPSWAPLRWPWRLGSQARPAKVPTGAQQTTPSGSLAPLPKPVVPPTSPDAIYPIPGGSPLPGNGPQPTLPEMAKELGRIEQKLHILLNPVNDLDLVPEWIKGLNRLTELILANLAGGEYTLTAPCETDANGDPVVVKVPYSGDDSFIGVLMNKVDALAELQQAAKAMKQPTCGEVPQVPEYTGRSISVNFISTEPSPMSGEKIRKVFRYRDQSGKDLAQHRDHWKNFAWRSGPWMVFSQGAKWGMPQVWATSPAEGQRVLRHAASIAGVDLDAKDHRFVHREVANGRYGPDLSMRVRRDKTGEVWVTERNGASGVPEVAAELISDPRVTG